MLDISPSNLWTEVKAAEGFRDSHLSGVPDMLERYTGKGYRNDWDPGGWSENHMYEFIRLTTGTVIYDNPRVRAKTARPHVQGDIAKGMQFKLNKWCKDVKLRRLLKRVYAHQCFAYAAVQVAAEPLPNRDPRGPAEPHQPQAYLLEQDRFGFDPLCNWYGQARYVFHKWVRDKEDMIDEAKDKPKMGWDLKAIKAVSEGSGIEDLKDRQSRNKDEINRNEIVGYEIWVPEVHTLEQEDGFNGTIYTIAAYPTSGDRTETVYIRKPRAFYGPRRGPYIFYGVYPVPTDPYPLSPFMATQSQQEELNAIVTAINQGIAEYKRVVIGSADNPDIAKIAKAKNGKFIPVRGFNRDQIEVIEMGGITPQHKEQLAQALERLDRNTGITDTHKGNVKSGATATEIAVADQAKQESIAYIKQEFADGTIDLLESVGWYYYHDDRMDSAMGEEAAAFFEMNDPYMKGGSFKDESGMSFDDLTLELEPYSMARMNEALAQSQYAQMMQLVLASAPIIPMAPFFDWKALFDKGGETVNDREFGDVFSPEVAGQSMGMALAKQQMEMSGAGGEGGAPPSSAPGLASQPKPSGGSSTSPGHMAGNVRGQQIAAERGKRGAGT